VRIRKRYWILAIPLVLVGSCLLVASTRYHVRQERDGWVWDSSHQRLICPVCTGRMERLECDGHSIPLPRAPSDPNDHGQLTLYTPVGTLRRFPQDGQWHPYAWGHEPQWSKASEAISDDELRSGYYEMPSSDPDGTGWPRKSGTPAHWCIGISEKHERWLDPTMIDQLDW
jgi:hypothetical protein